MNRRTIAGLINGQQVYFVEDGTPFGDPEQVSGINLLPELPTPETIESGPWGTLGKMATHKSNVETNKFDIIGCDDDIDESVKVGYNFSRITVSSYKSISLTSQYVPQEALDLSYGLMATNENAYKQGWIYFRGLDTQASAGDQTLVVLALYGKLSLSDGMSGGNEVTQVSWVFDVDANSLAESMIKNLNA